MPRSINSPLSLCLKWRNHGNMFLFHLLNSDCAILLCVFSVTYGICFFFLLNYWNYCVLEGCVFLPSSPSTSCFVPERGRSQYFSQFILLHFISWSGVNILSSFIFSFFIRPPPSGGQKEYEENSKISFAKNILDS